MSTGRAACAHGRRKPPSTGSSPPGTPTVPTTRCAATPSGPGATTFPPTSLRRPSDLRVISGFRALDFWHCGVRALYPCPNGARRCGKHHATPKPRDVLFDDLVRKTAAGEIVPVEHRTASKTHRFWVTSTDRDRLEDLRSDDTVLPLLSDKDVPGGASANRPTCRPAAAVTALAPPVAIPSEPLKVTIPRQLSPIPSLPAKPAIAPAPSPTPTPPPSPPTAAKPVRFLDWRASSHWSSEAGPCRHCRKLTHLLDSQAVHAHKVCAEEAGGE